MGAVYNQGPLTFTAGEALEAHRRVKLSGDRTVVYADAGDSGIGTVRYAVESGGKATVDVDNMGGTKKMVANGAISQNADVYPAADGKVGSAVTGEARGIALQAATADGDVIEVLTLPANLRTGRRAALFEIDDDFDHWVDGDLWTETADAGATGTTGVTDAVNGVMSVFCDGDDNDEAYLHTTYEVALFADDKPFFFEARVALSEANTDDANVFVGLSSAALANTLTDNGAGPPATYSGACFYKVDGGTAWAAEVSDGSTQTAVTLSTSTFPGDGTFQRLGIEFVPTAANTADINFYLDGVLVGTASDFDYSNATEMHLVFGVKAGGANEEELKIDYATFSKVR